MADIFVPNEPNNLDIHLQLVDSGPAGYSPTISISETEYGFIVQIDDVSGTTTTQMPVPKALSDLTQDNLHQTVTQEEKEMWDSKQPSGDYALSSDIAAHRDNHRNPHQVTAEQIGAEKSGAAATVQSHLTQHIQSLNNPHLVTAQQVGADPLGSAEAVNRNLTTHTNHKNNPHNVTLEQIGAEPVGAAKEVKSLLETHQNNTNNPHGVTASQIGALPNTTHIPSNIGELTNDVGFITNTATNLVNYYQKSEVNSLIDEIDVPTNLSELESNAQYRTVTDAEKNAWNSKYDLPTDGIPKSALNGSVQESLSKADASIGLSDLDNYVTTEFLLQQLSNKMEYYIVHCDMVGDNYVISKNGVEQTYAMLKSAFDDEKLFLYLIYNGHIYIPSIDISTGIIFSDATIYRETDDFLYTEADRILVTVNDNVSYAHVASERLDNKTPEMPVDGVEGLTEAEKARLFPSVGAVEQYTNERLDVVNSGISNLQIDVNRIEGSVVVSQNDYITKEDLKLFAIDNKIRMSMFFTWERGYIASGTGENYPDARNYRIRTVGKTTLEQDITFSVANGFRAVVYSYNGSVYGGDRNVTEGNTYTVTKGQTIRLVVMRMTENTSENADISEFINAITISEKPNIPNIADLGELERGGISGSTGANIEDRNYRVRNKSILHFDKHMRFYIASGYRVARYIYGDDGAYIKDYGAVTGELFIEKGTNVRFLIMKVTEDYTTADIGDFASKVTYKTDELLGNDLVSNIYQTTKGSIDFPIFSKVKSHGGIITVIDDDTLNLAHIKLFHDVCVDNGIVGDFSVETTHVQEGNFAPVLKSYEEEGFHMSFHCRDQQEYFRPDSGIRNLDLVKQNFAQGMQAMNTFGFTDWKFWVSPYGSADKDLQDLARKWGMNCLVSITQSDYNDFTGNEGRFNIRRVGFNQTDSGATSFAKLKQIIDEAAQNDGWVLVGTHMYTWDSNVGYSRFAEMVNYAKSKGLTFKTLNEAYRIREPIYKFSEMF